MSPAANTSTPAEWDRLQRKLLIAGVAGLVVAGGGALLFGIDQFFRSYLVAFVYWLGIPLGCLAILMLQYLTGGTWGLVLRRILEASTRTLFLLVVFFVPLMIGLRSVYVWAGWPADTDAMVEAGPPPGEAEAKDVPPERLHEEKVREADLMHNKRIFFQLPFFLARAACYFLVWLALAFLLNSWSRRLDEKTDPAVKRRCEMLSGPGLVLYGLTITLAAIDWTMSINPEWTSTIYPVLFAVGQILTGLAFSVTVLLLLLSQPPFAGVVTRPVLRDLGNLLLAFVMIWAYMQIAQYLLIWSENLPEETIWYRTRAAGAWQWVALLLILCHFALPFLLLLSRDIKENSNRLVAVAIGLLVMRWIDLFWWIEPGYDHEGQYVFWLVDIAALIGLGGIWGCTFLWQLKKRPLLPVHELVTVEGGHHA